MAAKRRVIAHRSTRQLGELTRNPADRFGGIDVMRASMLLAHINLYLTQVTPPNPDPKAPPGKIGDATNFVLGLMKWGGLASAVGAFIAAGIMMIVGRRNRNSLAVDGAMSMPWIVGGLALVLGAASIVSLLI